ncbi:hypothetical protein ABAC460_06560 [Asticcacaulis sp. AC460]|uniref:hypothetical protein n=1 Tax=Asticcacaulis sp. AC460 TaxID=1282360 RepID=UPI0003C3B122|nr:hypothetical protein [Asticcacaulis sp. AC460]ESQ91220.1 hypothetical protein ABAC460_06560 [Asticcacaulis sp. AC460]
MNFPEPVAGLVVRYSYLWHDDKIAGAVEGSKDRPAAIVMRKVQENGHPDLVFVLPITHTEPKAPTVGVAIPWAVARATGLDDIPQWVVVSEVNYFNWPGYDLRADPKTGRIAYGMLPKTFFGEVHAAMVRQIHTKAMKTSKRTE